MAASLIVNASGAVNTAQTVLVTPEELDQAAEKAGKIIAEYRAPGQ
jgi:hypothetical protein